MRTVRMTMETLNLFLVSDSMGKTVELLALAAAGRFGVEFAAVRRFYEPIDEREAENIVKEASCSRSVLVCALVEKKTRAFLSARCAAFGVPFVDLLGQLHKLADKDVVCWCAPARCHGDVLIRMANQESR